MIVQDNLYDRYGVYITKPQVDPLLQIRKNKIKKIKQIINNTNK